MQENTHGAQRQILISTRLCIAMTRLTGYVCCYSEYNIGDVLGINKCAYDPRAAMMISSSYYLHDVTVEHDNITYWKSAYALVDYATVTSKITRHLNEYSDYIRYLVKYPTYDAATGGTFIARAMFGRLTRCELDRLVKFMKWKRIACRGIIEAHTRKF